MENISTVPSEHGKPGELLLAMDTAAREGSLALGRLVRRDGDHVVDTEILAKESISADEEHASLLIPRVGELLDAVGACAGDLHGVVVGAGPGSFTGVRIGAATAKGMAWSLGIPLWPFSSLAGAAAGTEADPMSPRLVLFDARGDRVYAAAYRWTHGTMETLLTPRATTVGEVLENLIPPGALLMGDGAVRHRSLLEGAGNVILPAPAGHPSAIGLLRLLTADPGASPEADPGRWEPEYLRESGAERMWRTRGNWKGS